ncbi:MAG: mono/diheme cytochrome c family protein [Chlamydiales bacterium]|jgi:mono/diheme cytochrome c family protein
MPSIRFTFTASLAALALAWPGIGDEVGQAPGAATHADVEYETSIRPFLAQHCFRCHGEEKQKAGLRIDDMPSDFVGGPALDQWLEVVEKLVTDEMAPEGQAQRPAPEESGRVAEWGTEPGSSSTGSGPRGVRIR